MNLKHLRRSTLLSPSSASNRPELAYFYDDSNPLLAFPDGIVRTNGFARGRLSHVTDLSGEEHISYDARGRINWKLREISIDGKSKTAYMSRQDFDASDRLATLTLPDNSSIRYAYDVGGRISTRIIVGSGTLILNNVEYSPAGLPIRTEYGNGVITREYDPRLRTVGILSELRSGPPLLSLQYTFDSVSNVTRIDDRKAYTAASDPRDKTATLQYDDLYRLVRVTYPHVVPPLEPLELGIQFQYDEIGNLIGQTSDLAEGA